MKIKAAHIYLIYVSFSALLFIIIKNVREVYFIEEAGLNAFQLVLLGTTLEFTNLVFEIPTGVVADRYSRKLSVLIGLFLTGISFTIVGLYPIFLILVICQFVWGLGGTFTSGADEAWIADEEKNVEILFLKGAQLGQILSIIGIIISSFIGSVNLRLPFILSGVLFIVLGFFLVFFMKETNFKRSNEEHNLYKSMFFSLKTVANTIRKNPLLLFFLLLSLFYGLYSEGFDRLWTAHFLKEVYFPKISVFILIRSMILCLLILTLTYTAFNIYKQRLNKKISGYLLLLLLLSLIYALVIEVKDSFWTNIYLTSTKAIFEPLIYISMINLAAIILSIIFVEYIKRRLLKTGTLEKVWLLFVLNVLMTVTLISFSLTREFYLTCSLYMSFYIVRRTNEPVYRAWLNQNIQSTNRATILSIYGQIDSLGQLIGGPIIGYIAYITSISRGLLLSGIFLLPVVVIYILFIKRLKKGNINNNDYTTSSV